MITEHSAPARRQYIDWLRGLAVVIMIEAHTIDAWTRTADRDTRAFGCGAIVGGFAAPFFLFLAGVAVPLSMAAKRRKGVDLAAAAWAVQRRGWQVFGLALLFRLQAKLLGGGTWQSLLKVDILNIMGPSIAMAAALIGIAESKRIRMLLLAGSVAAFGWMTPVVRAAGWVRELPDFLEAYLRPVPGLTNFAFFPWAGFLLGGAITGVMLSGARDRKGERRANTGLLSAGVTLALGGYLASYLPSPYAASHFWTSSPAFFALRLGIVVLAVPLAFAWESRLTSYRWSPVQAFGRASLFLYWIHVEMVYGLLSAPLHRQLSLAAWSVAFVCVLCGLLALAMLKEALVTKMRARRARMIREAVELS